MARPWISFLLLFLVLVVIEAREEKTEVEDCPKNSVCVIFSRGKVFNPKGVEQKSNGRTGYLWEIGSKIEHNYYHDGLTAGLWIRPITPRKWNFVVTGFTGNDHELLRKFTETSHELRKLKFELGNATIAFKYNNTAAAKEETIYMEVTKHGEQAPSSTHTAAWHLFFQSGKDWFIKSKEGVFTEISDKTWKYERYAFEVEFNDEKLIDVFGGDVVKIIEPETSEMNDPRFNELLHLLSSEDALEAVDDEEANIHVINRTMVIAPDGTVKCHSQLWYRKSSEGEWLPLDSIRWNNGRWEGIYTEKVEKTEAPEDTEESTTEGGDQPEAGAQRAVRAGGAEDSTAEPTEPEPESTDLTEMDVICSAEPPAAAPMTGSMTKIAIGVGIGIFLLVVIGLIGGALFFVLRRKRATAVPNDTFRGSDSKAQTPIGGSMSKKSGSVAEVGGMSPADNKDTIRGSDSKAQTPKDSKKSDRASVSMGTANLSVTGDQASSKKSSKKQSKKAKPAAAAAETPK